MSSGDSPSRSGSPAFPAVGSSDEATPSPSPSFSSDKENRTSARRSDKRKTRNPASQSTRTPQAMADASNKRRRLSEKGVSDLQSHVVSRRRPRHIQDTDLYDPDQDPEERRKVRKGFRDLVTNLNGSTRLHTWINLCGYTDCFT